MNAKNYLISGIVLFVIGAIYVAFFYTENTPIQSFLFPWAILALLGGLGLVLSSVVVFLLNMRKNGKNKNTAS